MHDRRIDGVPHTFGNYGALFMNAMTWWDHETNSVWSQPWGRAIEGEYRGVELFLMPSQVTTWGQWKQAYPNTLAMINDVSPTLLSRRQGFQPNFVLGLALEDQARAYYYRDVQERGVLNDSFAGHPIVVWAGEASLMAYFRVVDGRTLTFEPRQEGAFDLETGSRWDLSRGLATEGELRGQALQPVPSTTSYDWAWIDFYPDSTFYQPP